MKKVLKRIKIIHILIGLALLGAIFVLGLEIANANRIVYGLRLADAKIGGAKIEEAQEILKNSKEDFLQKDIELIYKENGVEINKKAKPEELGLAPEEASTLKEITSIGRKSNIIIGLGQQIKALFGGYNIAFRMAIDEKTLESYIHENFGDVENPSINATLYFDEEKNEFLSQPSKTGQIINQTKPKEVLMANAECLKAEPVWLELERDYPLVTSLATSQAKEKAQKILDNFPYILRFEEKEWELEKEILISWFDFYPQKQRKNYILGAKLDEEKIKDYLLQLVPGFHRDPVNAVLSVKGGRVTAFALSENGVELNTEESAAKIIDSIEGGEKEIALAETVMRPEIATEDIDNLGLTSLIGKGVSNFAGSPRNRIHNIGVGAKRFNGVLIKPREEFSFNKTLGEVGPQTGYLAELVIKSDRTIPEYGGGLCQVSTTTFRAAVNSGLEVTERYPHAFAVKYYDPQGFDATIYPPHPDLRFINDTPGNILIQTRVSGYYLTFEFYGTDDGREIEVIGPKQYDKKSDGSMKAELTQKITKDGEVIREKIFYSNYRSPLLYPVIRNPLE